MNRRQGLVTAYKSLGQRVNQMLRIQNGDVARLRAQVDEVRAFAADAERVCLACLISCHNTHPLSYLGPQFIA